MAWPERGVARGQRPWMHDCAGVKSILKRVVHNCDFCFTQRLPGGRTAAKPYGKSKTSKVTFELPPIFVEDESNLDDTIFQIPTITGDPLDGRDKRGLNPKRHGRRRKNLKIACEFLIGDEPPIPLEGLVDTGAELNLVRAGLIPKHCLRPSEIPFKLTGADGSRVQRGTYHTVGQL